MPQQGRTVTRFQELDDGPGTLGAGDDAKFVQWDNGSGALIMAVTAVSDTYDNILARTGDPTPTFAYATDEKFLMLWDGSQWNKLDWPFFDGSRDLGYRVVRREGYYSDLITDKDIFHIVLGTSDRTDEGGIRFTGSELQVYLNGSWQPAVLNFRLRETSDGELVFEHQPIGFDEWLRILSGHSENNLGANGIPITRQGMTDVGAYPLEPVIDGGTF